MTISENVLVEDSLEATEQGCQLQILLNWYRSLPLSCAHTLELQINGSAVPRERLSLLINGCERGLDELVDLTEEQWFVQDRAVLRVRRDPPLKPGEQVHVALRLGCFIPYILNGPTTAFENRSSMSRNMRVH